MSQPQEYSFYSNVSSSDGAASFGVPVTTSHLGDLGLDFDSSRQPTDDQLAETVRNAVYFHIQAVRSMGRTTIHTAEIADSLGLPRIYVDEAIVSLQSRGVRVIK